MSVVQKIIFSYYGYRNRALVAKKWYMFPSYSTTFRFQIE